MNRSDRRTFLANGVRAGVVAAAVGTFGTLGTQAEGTGAAEASPPAPAVGGRPGTPSQLRVNGMDPSIGVDPDSLFLAFRISDARRGARQGFYRIVVSTSRGAPLWDSGKVASGRQAFISYTGPRLSADTEYRWTVTSADLAGQFGPTSPPAPFWTGLRRSDWQAMWLRPGPTGSVPEEYAYLRRVVRPSASPIVRATAYVAATHKYQLWVNGVMADTGPSFSYPDESYYQATDLTTALRPGQANALGVLHHWYSSGSGRPLSSPGLLAQVNVRHADGTHEVFGTDGLWRERPGEWQPAPQRNNESGEFVEIIDGRDSPLGWSEVAFDDASWSAPTVLGPVGTAPFTTLYALRTRIAEHQVAPVSVHTLPTGAVVVDFGKVIAARPTVFFEHGVSGRTVPMHVGYLLDSDGHVSTTHGTQATDLSFSYIQRDGAQTFEPYTFLGFRYLEVDSPGEAIGAGHVAALARHAGMPDVAPATFSSSSPTLDAVWALCAHSALYASHEQFVDTPTRQKGQFCSDSTNESQAIMHAYGDQNLSWQALRDFARSQARYWPDGRVNEAYPDGNGAEDIPDFTELYPEWVWRYFIGTGDHSTLVDLYPVVQRISDYIWRAVDPASGLVTNLPGGGGDYLGGLVDWPPQMRYGYDMGTTARTTVNVLAVNVFTRVSQIATVLGDSQGALAQTVRAGALSEAINARLIGPTGVYIDGLESDGSQSGHASQQASALALTYGIVPDPHKDAVAAHVAGLRIAMGPDHGMELLRGLHAAGLDAHMVDILTDPHGPGWANILASGGTFTWEDWEPSDLDGDSMSHGWGSGALVAILEALLGLTMVAPGPDGRATLAVAPPAGGLASASGRVPTTAGVVGLRWRRSSRRLNLSLSLPPNASAQLVLPGTAASLREGGRALRAGPGIEVISTSPAGPTTLALGAGNYAFVSDLA
jgi:alpha-L-rhamnosidase